MQLNKYLALCGITSRRKANIFIVEGRVTINGDVVQKLGIVVDPKFDTIQLDGRHLHIPQQYQYVLLNKPAGAITSAVDGRGRPTVLDVIGTQDRLFPVGRLDLDTEGVLLITNDGDLAYRLTHPSFEIQKIYQAWVEGQISEKAVQWLQQGVEIETGVTVSGEVKVIERQPHLSLVEIQVHEGKKRQIKRMLKAVGYPVRKLIRINFAGLTIHDLKAGQWRELSEKEVDALYKMAGLVRILAMGKRQ